MLSDYIHMTSYEMFIAYWRSEGNLMCTFNLFLSSAFTGKTIHMLQCNLRQKKREGVEFHQVGCVCVC